jgi:hypothetical protein
VGDLTYTACTELMVEFDQLDESLQDTFAAFLAERGVDESLCEYHPVFLCISADELANFIISFAEYKEQKVSN